MGLVHLAMQMYKYVCTVSFIMWICIPFMFFLFYIVAAQAQPKKTLTLKAPITTAADNIHKYFFIVLQ